jgi:hypothetical protein
MKVEGRIKAHKSYLMGENRQQAMVTTKLSVGTISKYYCEFEIAEFNIKAGEKVCSITQINAIERALFKAIANGSDSKIVDELQKSYVTFKI